MTHVEILLLLRHVDLLVFSQSPVDDRPGRAKAGKKGARPRVEGLASARWDGRGGGRSGYGFDKGRIRNGPLRPPMF